MNIKHDKGFTLVELLIAVMILSGAISGVLLLYTSSMISSQQAWDTTVAVIHGEHILEEMQAKKSRSDILNTNWSGWVKGQGLNTLSDEEIKITFADPDDTPLDIEVRINWQTKSRENFIVLNTKMTK